MQLIFTLILVFFTSEAIASQELEYYKDIYSVLRESTNNSVSYISNAPLFGIPCERRTLVRQGGVEVDLCIKPIEPIYQEITSENITGVKNITGVMDAIEMSTQVHQPCLRILKPKDCFYSFQTLEGQQPLYLSDLGRHIVFTGYNETSKKGFMFCLNPLVFLGTDNPEIILDEWFKHFSEAISEIEETNVANDGLRQHRRVRNSIDLNCVCLWPSRALNQILILAERVKYKINLYAPQSCLEVTLTTQPIKSKKTKPQKQNSVQKERKKSIGHRSSRKKSATPKYPPTLNIPTVVDKQEATSGMKHSKSHNELRSLDEQSSVGRKISLDQFSSSGPTPMVPKKKRASLFTMRRAKSNNSSPRSSAKNSPEDSPSPTPYSSESSPEDSPKQSPKPSPRLPGHEISSEEGTQEIRIDQTVNASSISLETFLSLVGQRYFNVYLSLDGTLKLGGHRNLK